MFTHVPVLLNETIAGLNVKPGGIYVDLTLGRAGHSQEILRKLKTGYLIGVDQDEEALKESKATLEAISYNFILVKSNFVNLEHILKEKGVDKVDGILMDLGVSSPQFDDPSRGFSYKEDAPLDMRMDTSNTLTAAKIVNTYSLQELTRVFRDYGDEMFAYQIAKNIIKQRQVSPIKSTLELVESIKASKPMKILAKQGHPAKQAFQALRIEVNNEINVLKETLVIATKHLNSGGRLAVITFHSGEDKIVKDYFRSLTVREGNRLDLPREEEKLEFKLVNTKPIVAKEEELELNHRSKSAKLRIIEKL